jgi:vitamin B12/bleomycin/antimicrobial peptide transport system ATP-binding/permease protein
VITQSAIAFTQLLGALSLIVNQFGSISSFTAVVARLSGLAEAVETINLERPEIETAESLERISYERLTLLPSGEGRALLADLSLSVPRGMRVLVTGPNESARVALFRATAGISTHGEGRVLRPPSDGILFLPQQPFLTPGTLRQALVRTRQEKAISDEHILAAIRDAGLESVVTRAGGLDTEREWAAVLSLGEQQLVAVTRLILARPAFALLDRVSTTLGPARLRQALRRLTDNSITYINFDEPSELVELYDAVLEIDADGAWYFRQLDARDRGIGAGRSAHGPDANLS